MQLTFFTALSLVFHLLLLALIAVWNVRPTQFPDNQPVEVVYKDKPETPKKEKIFIRDLKIPDRLKFEDPVQTDFASAEKIRVLQETRARETGLTKNRDHGPKFLMEDQPRQERREQTKWDKEGYQVFDPKKELQQFDSGESTISVTLPDSIAVGSFTALNTDRHLYYSFYARLEDMIYIRWADLIHKAVDSYSYDFKKRRLSGKTLKTDLVVLLKPNGEFYRAEIHNASGIERLDMSPALAFQDARIFPNPPQEMVREDGFIHISYSFVVDFGRVQ